MVNWILKIFFIWSHRSSLLSWTCRQICETKLAAADHHNCPLPALVSHHRIIAHYQPFTTIIAANCRAQKPTNISLEQFAGSSWTKTAGKRNWTLILRMEPFLWVILNYPSLQENVKVCKLISAIKAAAQIVNTALLLIARVFINCWLIDW